MIQKIKNLVLEKPTEYLDNEWAKLLAFKHKLLFGSDWTQLYDSPLTRDSKLLWKAWRHKIRSITRNDNILDIEIKLKDLDNNKPMTVNNTSIVDNFSLDDYKLTLYKLLYGGQSKEVEKFNITNGSKELIISKYEEAINFLSDNDIEDSYYKFPFLKVLSSVSSEPMNIIAQNQIDVYKNYMLLLIKLEKVKVLYTTRINDSIDKENCDKILDELVMLYGY